MRSHRNTYRQKNLGQIFKSPHLEFLSIFASAEFAILLRHMLQQKQIHRNCLGKKLTASPMQLSTMERKYILLHLGRIEGTAKEERVLTTLKRLKDIL